MMASQPNTFMLPGLNVPLRVVPERRRRSWQRKGVLLIVNNEHRDMVLAVKAGRSGE